MSPPSVMRLLFCQNIILIEVAFARECDLKAAAAEPEMANKWTKSNGDEHVAGIGDVSAPGFGISSRPV